MMKNRVNFLILISLFSIISGCVFFKSNEPPAYESTFTASQVATQEMPAAPRKIHVGDVAILHVVPGKEFEKDLELAVNLDGEILVPLVGWVKIENLTTSEAEEEIRKRLDKDYLVDPTVSVRVKEANSRAVVLLGQLKKPGTYEFPATAKMTLLEAVAKAEGFTDIASLKSIKIVRSSANGQQTIKVNAEKILSGDAPDVELQEGDLITVPESVF